MENTIGQRIIHKRTLSVQQADEVCHNLDQLSKTGQWNIPTWATELAEHYGVAEAHVVVQLAGWRAAAKAYNYRLLEQGNLNEY